MNARPEELNDNHFNMHICECESLQIRTNRKTNPFLVTLDLDIIDKH